MASLVKFNHGITERQHLIDPRRLVFLRVVRRVKEGTSAASLQEGLDETWWADSRECHFEMSKTSWVMWKHVMNGDLENHLKA